MWRHVNARLRADDDRAQVFATLLVSAHTARRGGGYRPAPCPAEFSAVAIGNRDNASGCVNVRSGNERPHADPLRGAN
jgi:hypothetical protein